jgi:TRAP-type C4-dicarboxylate transport system substrate-binding protein
MLTLGRLTAVAFIAGATLALVPGASTLAAESFTMKIGTPTINDVQHQWMKTFKGRIEKRSGGQIKVELYPASQLGKIPRMIEGMQLGTVESVVAPAAFLVGVDKRNSALSVPGLFDDIDHCWRVFGDNEFRDTMFPLMEAKGIVAIGILCAAPQAFLTKKKIDKLSDLSGLKIRVLASDLEIKPMQALGIEPTPMPFSDVVPGLQRNQIDGVSSIPILFSKLKMYNVAKHITTTNLIYFGVPIYVSAGWFKKLPAGLQKMVREEARASELAVVDWNNAANAKTLEDWKSAGGTVSNLPAAEQAKLVSTVNAAAAKVLADQPAVNAFFQKINVVVQRHK